MSSLLIPSEASLRQSDTPTHEDPWTNSLKSKPWIWPQCSDPSAAQWRCRLHQLHRYGSLRSGDPLFSEYPNISMAASQPGFWTGSFDPGPPPRPKKVVAHGCSFLIIIIIRQEQNHRQRSFAARFIAIFVAHVWPPPRWATALLSKININLAAKPLPTP